VVDDGQRLVRGVDLAAGHAQALEGLRAGDLMDEVAVDIEQAGAVLLPVDDVVVEDLVVERAWRTAAESQIGQTVHYDPAYTRIAYPMGDVPLERGVCTDVIIRAYRQSAGIDLQERVHRDMTTAFAAYPKSWGARRPDTSIDHRRVPNLATFFQRAGAAIPISKEAKDYRPGDIVTQMLPGNLPHIGIVTQRANPDGSRPLLVHNIGAGTRLEDRLFEFRITGHYRYVPRAV
jgi:uncharacterized protein YijF (DUF1287 family)